MQLRVAKEEPQQLNWKTTHTRLAKEDLQEVDHQKSNPRKPRSKIQGWMQGGI